ncbi:hypothetical protein [Streptomyces sp. NPDC056670]|uniref:hypothetical protein n=1 Tax=Streptomyces sp. NPDC056670 TaxID=3345904 RepID=UPI0036D0475A
MTWPDVEIELVAWLSAQRGGGVTVLTELPANLGDLLPVVQVQRVGGDDDTFKLDRALVDVDVYAPTRAGASLLARQVRDDLVMKLRGTSTAAAVFGLVTTVSAPQWRPYENINLRRLGATYELYFHPVS